MVQFDSAVGNIKKYCSGKRVVASVSGGADSMCLLHLILSCRVCCNLVVVTFDHQLRPSSGDEVQLVQDYCSSYGIECVVYSANILTLSKVSGNSIELQARQWRREIYKKLLCQHDVVVLGHHADDQIETVLYRVFRGTGIKGLVGMSDYKDGILRPLLNIFKADILVYNRQHSVAYVQDSSNDSIDFDRNYIRNVILPNIKARWSTSNILRLSQTAKESVEYYQQQMDKSLVKHSSQATSSESGGQANSAVVYDGQEKRYHTSLPLTVLHPPLGFFYVQYALSYWQFEYNSKLINRIIGLAHSTSGKQVKTKNIVVTREFDSIVIRPLPDCDCKQDCAPVPMLGCGMYTVGQYRIEVLPCIDCCGDYLKQKTLESGCEANNSVVDGGYSLQVTPVESRCKANSFELDDEYSQRVGVECDGKTNIIEPNGRERQCMDTEDNANRSVVDNRYCRRTDVAGQRKCEDYTSEFDSRFVCIDFDMIPKDSVWRTRKPGDIIKINGHTKTIKKYIIEKKIPISIRDRIVVLADKNNILLLHCMAVSDIVRLNDKSVNASKVVMRVAP